MPISVSRKTSKLRKRAMKELSIFESVVAKLYYRVPVTIFLMILLVLWSCTTTIISGNIVHICVSSRKLNNLYCLSAGSNPNFQIPISPTTGSSIGDHGSIKIGTQGYPDDVLENSTNLSIKEFLSVVHDNNTTLSIEELPSVVLVNNTSLAIKELPSIVLENNTNLLVNNNLTDKERDAELAYAMKVVKEQLQVHRSWTSSSKGLTTCDGRGIYVYDLPSKFNKDLLGQCGDMFPWLDFCKYFGNAALGKPIRNLGKGWYQTHQYSLEPIFHSRIMKHPCRVHNVNEAKLFYVPFYGGLDILRWHFKNVSIEVKDSLALDLIKWLETQATWGANSGKDHVFVLGKISWDFRRSDSQWGSKLLNLDQMQNPIKLLIERQPWHVNDIGIPHPTNFHPHSDEDIIQWQTKIIQSSRKTLVSFAGGARPDSRESIRSVLINQCKSTSVDKCSILNCSAGECDQPEAITNIFLESEFCLQPPGDSPTRRSVFDSLISGCIPVLFDPFTAYFQYPWHLPEDHEKYSVFIDQEDVRKAKVNVVERLMKVPKNVRDDMRRYIVYELMPGLVYGDQNSEFEKFQDAFSVTMNNLLERVTRLD